MWGIGVMPASGRGVVTSQQVDEVTERGSSVSPWHRVVPSAATLVAVLVAAVVIIVATAPPGETTASPGAGFAATDGTAATVAIADSSLVVLVENQRAGGGESLASLPQDVALGLLPQIDDIAALQVWRSTTFTVSETGRRTAAVSLHAIGPNGIELLAVWGGNYSAVFSPAMRLLPAEVVVGAQWEDSGEALEGGALTYEQAASVVAVDDDGCATVRRSLELTVASGEPFTARDEDERWCPGDGIVAGTATEMTNGRASTFSYETVDAATSARLLGQIPDPPSAGSAPTDPQRWEAQSMSTVARDDYFGEMPVGGIGGLSPLATDDGLLIVPVDSGNDLAAFRADTSFAGGPPVLVEQWRVHPGGELLWVAVLGDRVVVSTSDRTVVAYDLGGFRRWTVTTEDLVLSEAVRTDGGLIVIHALDGSVTAVDARDGQVRWEAETATDADARPVVVGGTVVVFDRSGQMLALDAESGTPRWEQSTEVVTGSGAVGNLIVTVDAAGSAQAYDDAGELRWSLDLGETAGEVADTDERAVVFGSTTVASLNVSVGELVWEELVTGAVTADRRVILVGGDRLCSFNADGEQVRCWDLPAPSEETGWRLALSASGAWAVDANLAVVRIGLPLEGQ